MGMNKKALIEHLKALSEMSHRQGSGNPGLEKYRNRLKSWASGDPKPEKPIKTIRGRTDEPPRKPSPRKPRPGG